MRIIGRKSRVFVLVCVFVCVWYLDHYGGVELPGDLLTYRSVADMATILFPSAGSTNAGHVRPPLSVHCSQLARLKTCPAQLLLLSAIIHCLCMGGEARRRFNQNWYFHFFNSYCCFNTVVLSLIFNWFLLYPYNWYLRYFLDTIDLKVFIKVRRCQKPLVFLIIMVKIWYPW